MLHVPQTRVYSTFCGPQHHALVVPKGQQSNSGFHKHDGIPLDQVPLVKLLGINTDANLDWTIHINSLSNSLSSKIGLLHRPSKFLPQSLSFTLL